MGKKFLIGQLGLFGDCLLATTIAKQIKHDNPDSHITWAIMAKYRSALDLNPHVDSVWEVNVPDGDYIDTGWKIFENEVEERRAKGDFDEVIFSQILPRNLILFYETIRGTNLRAYNKPITVPVSPVVRLSEREIENVRDFANKTKLSSFKNVVLFECSPGSGQSKMSVELALEISKTIIKKQNDICFILSTPKKLDFVHPQIIDASELTYRENAELTKYCTFFIGCCSGITWLATSDWAKPLPMLQLLDGKSITFAGVHFDFEINGLDNSQIIEMIDYDKNQVVKCLFSIFERGVEKTKVLFHQVYKPSYFHMENILKRLIFQERSFSEVKGYIQNCLKQNKKLNNEISVNYPFLILQTFYYCKVRYAHSGVFFRLKNLVKNLLWKKSHSLPE